MKMNKTESSIAMDEVKKPNHKILIVDDEKTLCQTFSEILQHEGYKTEVAFDGEEAIEKISKDNFDVIFCDLRMPKNSGMEVLEKVEAFSPQTFFIVMTAYGSQQTTLEALKKGAYDYVTKPLVFDDILLKLKNILNFKGLSVSQRLGGGSVADQFAFDNVLGQGPEMKAIYSLMQKVAATPSTVLITGELGVGKEKLARAIHHQSENTAGLFTVIRCGSYSEKDLENALFSAEGVFAKNEKATIFLDEIDALSLPLQKALADKLQAGGVLNKENLRLIVSTSRDLYKEVSLGQFRDDLYYRINVIELKIPPLRARKNDIPFMAKYYVRIFSEEFGKKIRYISDAAMDVLMNYPWSGNIRELQVILERALLLCENNTQYLDVHNLPSELISLANNSGNHNFRDAMRFYELKHIQWVLEKNRFDKKKSATDLGLSLSSLYRKIEELAMPMQ